MILPSAFCLLPLVALAWAGPINPLLCNCGLGSGEEMCRNTKQCSPLVIRPMDIPKPSLPSSKVVCTTVGGVPPLVPIKGPCTCHTALVKPAIVPRPPCKCCSATKIDYTNDQLLTLSQKQQLLFGGGHACPHNHALLTSPAAQPIGLDEVVRQTSNPADYVPADPVSLSVAYKLAQEANNRYEDHLSFGFRTMPKDIPIYRNKQVNNVAEGDLLSLNGQIVELRPPTGAAKSVDEEAVEALLDLADEENEKELHGPIKRISLGEIGYGPAKMKPANFVNVANAANPGEIVAEAALKPVCADGFKPGLVTITQVPKGNHVVLPPQLPEPCHDESEEAADGYDYPAPPLPLSPYSFVSASSSSSLNKKSAQSMFMQKVGGGCGCNYY